MPWARLSDDWHDHPKVVAAGAEAAGVWAMCLTWARRQQKKATNPGVVPDDMLRRFAGSNAKAAKVAAKLLEVELFDERTPAGWPIHDFLDPEYSYTYDPAKKAEAGAKGGKARAAAQARAKQDASKLLQETKQDPGTGVAPAKQTASKPQATRAAARASTSYLPSPNPQPEPIPPTAGAVGAALVVVGGSDLVPANGVDVGAVVAEWLSSCTKRPPTPIVNRVGKAVKALAEDGIDAADIRSGLAAWQAKGADPSTLASFVNQAMNASPSGARRASTTDSRVAAGLELAAHYAQLDAAEGHR